MKALRRFTVRAHLPERLAALERLSVNLRWSWDTPTQDLFATIDPELRDYTEQYYVPAAQSLHRTIEPVDGVPFGAARQFAEYCERARAAWPRIEIADVDSYGLPDTPLLGSELTLTATVQLAGLRPDEVVVEAVLGRVDAGDALVDPQTVPMAHTGTSEGGNDVFSTTTPLPVAGPVGYTVRVLPCHPLLADHNELGLVTLA